MNDDVAIHSYDVETDDAIQLLAQADALVVEGTLAGCVAACTLARTGCKTVLAASGCSVPHEVVVGRRPWVTDEDLARLPEPFKHAFRASIEHQAAGGIHILNLSKLAIRVEDLLLDTGVAVFYGMTPCGVVAGAAKERLFGVVFGGKGGVQAIAADRIIDTTPLAMIPRLSGCSTRYRESAADRITVRLSAKVGVVGPNDTFLRIDAPQGKQACPTAWPEEEVLHVPDWSAVADAQVPLRGPYAEFALELPVDGSHPLRSARLSPLAREHLVEVGTTIAARRAAQGKGALYFHRFSGALLMEPVVRIRAAGTAKSYRPAGLDNLWVCSTAVDVADEQARDHADPYRLVRLAGEIVADVLSAPAAGADSSAAGVRFSTTSSRSTYVGGTPQRLRFSDRSRAAGAHKGIDVGEQMLPVLATCDVLVVGGGTSGVPAALAAAQAGASVILVEQNADVGGTQTVGGVGNYWFGRETPYQLARDKAYAQVSQQCGMAREVAMLKCLIEAGVQVLAPCTMVGVLREDDRVTGVVIATDDGLGVVTGKVVIDASGDADVAAWSGVPFQFGNGRDAWTMWASFGNFNVEKRTASRQYESAADVRDPRDLARTVVRGRRRQGMWRRLPHDMPQLYATPRESRRIEGRARVTYGGILAGETFPDVMTVCDSNFDIKGLASSDLICCGVVWGWHAHTRYLAAIPYRAIQPKHIRNLLVAGRSYCVSHDALALARMQRDMASLGAAAGIAAALAARTGTPPAELDVQALQGEWVRRGTLREEDLARFGRPWPVYTEANARRDVADLIKDSDDFPARLARLASSRVSIPSLRDAFAATHDIDLKVHLARVRCYLGDAATVPFLMGVIAEQISNGLPPVRQPTLAMPPEHGWAPEPAYSLYAIAMAGAGREAVSLMEQIARLVEDSAQAFESKERVLFEYVRAVCAVAERNPGPEMIQPLEVLLEKASLRDLAIPRDGDARLTVDPVLERRAYLELCLGRALARCADRRGYDILLRYAEDIRAPLAGSALDELAELVDGPLPDDRDGRQRLVRGHVAAAAVPASFGRRID